MELDRHQFTKNKTEDNLASVIASLMQKLYDKNVSATEFNSLLGAVDVLVKSSDLSTGNAQPPEPMSASYYSSVERPETRDSEQVIETTSQPYLDYEFSEPQRDDGLSSNIISRILHEEMHARAAISAPDIPVHTLE